MRCHYLSYHFLLGNIFIRLGNKVFRQLVRTPMGTHCSPLIVDLLTLYCYDSQCMAKLQKDPSKHSLIRLFNNNCGYLDNILTANNPNVFMYVKQISQGTYVAQNYKRSVLIFGFRYILFST